MLDRIALGANGIIALCLGNQQMYLTHLDKKFSQEVQEAHSYWQSLDTMGLQRVTISTWTDYGDDIELLMDKVLIHSGKNIGPGIGNWEPGTVVLLIGDRHGPSIQPYATNFNLAFCDMAKAGSSFWLSNQLEANKIPEHQLYWINAYDKDGVPTDPSFVRRLQPLAVLSMGDSAARWCQSNALAHESFTHPQYHKRFHFNEPYPLIEKLKELLK
jgi:hypothetical protein